MRTVQFGCKRRCFGAAPNLVALASLMRCFAAACRSNVHNNVCPPLKLLMFLLVLLTITPNNHCSNF